MSTAKEIEEIGDIGDVDDVEIEDEGQVEEGLEHCNVRVAAVEALTSYSGCMKCKAKVVPDVEDGVIGSCGYCGLMQCMEECDSELTAHVIVKGGNGRWMLRAFGKVVEDIAEKWGGGVTKVALLKARPFDMKIRDGIIKGVQRKPRET